MAKRSFKRRVHHRRGSMRSPRRGNKFTAIKLMKYVIAFAPVAGQAYGQYKANGGGANGIQHGLVPTIVGSYTGYNTEDKTFDVSRMTMGYVPILGAWLFGKIASRVIR